MKSIHSSGVVALVFVLITSMLSGCLLTSPESDEYDPCGNQGIRFLSISGGVATDEKPTGVSGTSSFCSDDEGNYPDAHWWLDGEPYPNQLDENKGKWDVAFSDIVLPVLLPGEHSIRVKSGIYDETLTFRVFRAPGEVDLTLLDECVENNTVVQTFSVSVAIVINQTEVEIPSGLGVEEQCTRLLNTQEEGIVNVNLLEDSSLRLGHLFSLWGQPFNATQLLGFEVIDYDHSLSVRIDGTPVTWYGKTTLQVDADISIEARYHDGSEITVVS